MGGAVCVVAPLFFPVRHAVIAVRFNHDWGMVDVPWDFY